MLCSARLSAAVRESAGMGLEHEEPQSLSEGPINFCHQILQAPALVLAWVPNLVRSTRATTSMSSASHGSFEGDAASLKRRLTIGTDTGQLARLVSEAQAVAKQSQVQHAGAPVGRKHMRKYAAALLPAASPNASVLAGNPIFRELAAGCLAGICEYTVCQPVDMVATRRMLATGENTSQGGMLAQIRGVYKEGGIKALFRGLGPQLMAAVPATCGMYVGERFFARAFAKTDGSTDVLRMWAAGTCSGVTETICVCPFEVLKVRLQSKEYIGRYNNTLHALSSLVRQEGATALYSGALPMVYRNSVFNGTFFAGCFVLREQVLPPSHNALESFVVDATCGTVMGAVATPAKMPFFVVKTRKQAAGSATVYPAGTLATMRHIAREEGAAALWKGTSV